MNINLSINGHPSQWHKLANKKARKACDVAGVLWESANVIVELPEHGRYMVKPAGKTQLCSIG